MSTSLEGIPLRCFQGVVPSTIATADVNGVPNITYLSHVFRIDDTHVALSCQFFNKTKANVLANPYATVDLLDPATLETYRLELRYDHAETSGALFDTMSMRIDAIASHTGMRGIFRLISSDVYEVISVEYREGVIDHALQLPETPVEPRSISEIRNLQLVTQRMCGATCLEEVMNAALSTLDEAFGFEHSMMLMLDETQTKLYTIATRGYEEEGIGAEIAIGEGLMGMVAREKRVLRMSDVEAELRYGRAIRASMQKTRARRDMLPEIPLAGLADAQSHMAMPLKIGDRMLGVLAVESRSPLAFDEWDETYIEIIGNQVAIMIDNMLLRHRESEATAAEGASRTAAAPQLETKTSARAAPAEAARPDVAAKPKKRFRFFKNDDCIFVDDEYLIRNVPARILWRVLREHQSSGRTEFTNRELRLDPWLGLPPLRDNLESRLVLLRKRLADKCPTLRLESTDRGRFHLEIGCSVDLEERESA
ncbi:MAG: GAF domain-containing protein [Polyangiaceae bacterium]